jgi:Flp pilus assembly CpaE family ATPase
VTAERPVVLVALSPQVEQLIEPLLFGEHAAVTIAASLVELTALERTLSESDGAEALLVSADVPGLSAGLLSRARSHGLRLIGIAGDEHDAQLLHDLPLDTILAAPIDPAALRAAAQHRSETIADTHTSGPRGPEKPPREREGAVLAVIGSRGAPGASELAASLAALAERWDAVLVELDLLGGGLALRLGADATQGSLLGLLRASGGRESAVGELLDRWLVKRPGWAPVLLAPPQPEQTIEELDQPGAIRAALEALATQHPLVFVDVGSQLATLGEVGPVSRCYREALLTADAVLLVLGSRETQLDAGLAQLDLLLDHLGIPAERIRIVCNGVGGPGAIPQPQLEQTLAVGLRERELAADAVIPWDGRALGKATRSGMPLAIAHPRGSYARNVETLLDTLFLPGAPVARHRKRLLPPLVAKPNEQPEPRGDEAREDEEVVLPWRS